MPGDGLAEDQVAVGEIDADVLFDQAEIAHAIALAAVEGVCPRGGPGQDQRQFQSTGPGGYRKLQEKGCAQREAAHGGSLARPTGGGPMGCAVSFHSTASGSDPPARWDLEKRAAPDLEIAGFLRRTARIGQSAGLLSLRARRPGRAEGNAAEKSGCARRMVSEARRDMPVWSG